MDGIGFYRHSFGHYASNGMPAWRNGRRKGLKIPFWETGVWVRVPLSVLFCPPTGDRKRRTRGCAVFCAPPDAVDVLKESDAQRVLHSPNYRSVLPDQCTFFAAQTEAATPSFHQGAIRTHSRKASPHPVASRKHSGVESLLPTLAAQW